MKYTEGQLEELRKAAVAFVRLHPDAWNEQAEIDSRAMRGEEIPLYVRVESYISDLFPRNKREALSKGRSYESAQRYWNTLKSEALAGAEKSEL